MISYKNKTRYSVLAILLFVLPLISFSQEPVIDKVFEKYSGKDGFTSVYISKHMFDLISKIDVDDPDFGEVKNITSGLNQIRILTQEGDGSGANFYKEIIQQIKTTDYKELMSVHESDKQVRMMVREAGDKISDFLMIVGGSENVLISIEGDIDLANISKLTKAVKVEGMDNLDKLDKK